MVAAPNPRSWTNGEFVDQAMLNGMNGIRDAMRFILDPPLVLARQTVSQSLGHNAYAAITFNAEDVDNEATAPYLSGVGMHDSVSNTSRLTCQTAGRYLLTGGIAFITNATGRRGSRWDLNGAQIQGSQNILPAGSTSGYDVSAKTIYVVLAVGDYVELKGFQDSGAAMSLSVASPSASFAAARWVGTS